ncbi:MAG: hypothetical protein R3324_05915 [Halobacteriales archaeon]|nr:hypothetical protein [Halobacteriales archaeon]
MAWLVVPGRELHQLLDTADARILIDDLSLGSALGEVEFVELERLTPIDIVIDDGELEVVFDDDRLLRWNLRVVL